MFSCLPWEVACIPSCVWCWYYCHCTAQVSSKGSDVIFEVVNTAGSQREYTTTLLYLTMQMCSLLSLDAAVSNSLSILVQWSLDLTTHGLPCVRVDTLLHGLFIFLRMSFLPLCILFVYDLHPHSDCVASVCVFCVHLHGHSVCFVYPWLHILVLSFLISAANHVTCSQGGQQIWRIATFSQVVLLAASRSVFWLHTVQRTETYNRTVLHWL